MIIGPSDFSDFIIPDLFLSMCQQTDCKTQLPGTTVGTNKWCDLKSNKCKIYLARASTLQLNFIVCRIFYLRGLRIYVNLDPLFYTT